jgi:hypothetical protein
MFAEIREKFPHYSKKNPLKKFTFFIFISVSIHPPFRVAGSSGPLCCSGFPRGRLGQPQGRCSFPAPQGLLGLAAFEFFSRKLDTVQVKWSTKGPPLTVSFSPVLKV